MVLRQHVIDSDLTIPLFFLREQSHLRGLHVYFHMDILVSVRCVNDEDLIDLFGLPDVDQLNQWLFIVFLGS